MPTAIRLVDRREFRTQGRRLRQRAPKGRKLLEIRGVETGYGRLKILRGIDMKVDAQGIVALLGGNGTDRSTLLKDICAFLLLIFVLMVRPTGLMGRLAKVKA